MIPSYDKYAPFIWSCYAISAVVLLLVLYISIRKAARSKAELEQLEQRRTDAAAPGNVRP